ncbi:hypothetical protein ACWDUL_38365 [Nocardia niigatensis]
MFDNTAPRVSDLPHLSLTAITVLVLVLLTTAIIGLLAARRGRGRGAARTRRTTAPASSRRKATATVPAGPTVEIPAPPPRPTQPEPARSAATVQVGTTTATAAPVWLDPATTGSIAIHARTDDDAHALALALLAQWADRPDLITLVGLDPTRTIPGTGVYTPIATHFADGDLIGSNNPDAAHTRLQQMLDTCHRRAETLPAARGFWHEGPTPDRPLIVLAVDNTFLTSTRVDRDLPADVQKAHRHRNKLAAANTLAVDELLTTGPDVGILVVLTTSRPLPAPTATKRHGLRYKLPTAIVFATTASHAKTALGPDITSHPLNPARLRRSDHLGIATMKTPGSNYIQLRAARPPR